MTLVRLAAALSLLTLSIACERSPTGTGQEAAPAGSNVAPTSLAVTVDAAGYHPDSVSAPAGRPVHLTITRTSDDGCGQQIVFPSLDIRRDLPLNKAVTVEFSMPSSGSLAFTCGMDMLRGSIIAQ
jgi:plastocyanin domain-containing protein